MILAQVSQSSQAAVLQPEQELHSVGVAQAFAPQPEQELHPV
jgi:hypothetical protein